MANKAEDLDKIKELGPLSLREAMVLAFATKYEREHGIMPDGYDQDTDKGFLEEFCPELKREGTFRMFRSMFFS